MVENNEANQYNEDELHAPEWLNKRFFEMIMCKYEDSDCVEIDKFDISPGSGKGDHYASIMFRVKINYNIKSKSTADRVKKYKSLIIKTEPEQEGLKKDVLQEFSLFQTEISMYSDIIPQMEKLLREVGDQTELCAKMIYSSLTPRKCIVFEDLVEKGYSVVSNRACTLEEVFKAIGKIARIHAASTKLLEDGNTQFLRFRSTFTKEAMEKFEMMRTGIKTLREVISEVEDLKKYVPYLEKVENTIIGDILSYFEPEQIRRRGGILVLNHGDFHMKNMMVSYEEGKLKDLMLVDYQISYYGSSAMDILYGYAMFFSPELRLNHRDEIFSKYFEIFQETLEKLCYKAKIPTKTDFDAELKRYKRWELFLILNFNILYYTFIDGGFELGELAENVEIRKQILRKEHVLYELRQQLQRLVKQGYFD